MLYTCDSKPRTIRNHLVEEPNLATPDVLQTVAESNSSSSNSGNDKGETTVTEAEAVTLVT